MASRSPDSALAGTPSGSATSNTRSQGTVDVQDLKVVQGHAESPEELRAEETANASLDVIRDRAKLASHKALEKLERRLSELAIEIDAEVRRIIQDSYHKAKDLLKTNLRLLHKVAESLLEKEVLDGSEIDAIVRDFGGNGGDPLASAAAAIA